MARGRTVVRGPAIAPARVGKTAWELMPEITEKITIDAPLDAVWPLLSDPEIVAACIPGATLAPDQEDDVWKGSIRVKFGPTVAVFRGEASLDYDHAAHRCTIEGRGIDQRGASRALASGIVTATGDRQTEVTVQGEYSVSGPLEAFANAGGIHVARALLAEFARNISERVGTAEAATAPSAAGAGQTPRTASDVPAGTPPSVDNQAEKRPPEPAGELNGLAVLWSAFKSWIRSLLSPKRS
jgi:carbon monoxide dehydrogenase subunit G